MRSASYLALVLAVAVGLFTPTYAHARPLSATTVCARPDQPDVTSVPGWIGYLAAHRSNYALTVRPLDGDPITHNADVPFPAASSIKLIHLAAYAQAVADGRLDPEARIPVADWQRWYIPLDGGAHVRALDYLRIPAHEGIPLDPSATVTYSQLADVMIRFSDSAAPDLLRNTLGDNALRAVMMPYGFTGPVPSLFDTYLAIANPLRPQTDSHLEATSNALNALMTSFADSSFGPGAELARHHLEYQGPMPDGSVLGFKGGSLPGVITEVFEYRTPEGGLGTGTLMVRGVSRRDVEADKFTHQKLLLAAITDRDVGHALRCLG